MKKAALAIAFMLAALAASASPLKATWIEGRVEKQRAANWIVLSMGDFIDSSDIVRLAKDALAEFSDGQRKIVISAAGVFSLSALAKAGAEQAKKRSGTLDRLGKIVDSTTGTGPGTVAGVRGELAGQSAEGMTWAGEDEEATSLLEEPRSLVREAKYSEAADSFAQVAGSSDGELKEEALYGQAWSLATAGSSLQAIKVLRGMAGEGAWSAPRALLLARLDLETGASAEATSLLNAAIASGHLVGEDLDLANAMLKEAAAAK